MLTELSSSLLVRIKAQGIASAPRECGGFVIRKYGHLLLKPIRNISKNPTTEIVVSTAEIGRIIQTESIQAFYHSHPGTEREFSEKDTEIMLTLLPYPWILYCVGLDSFNLMRPA